MICNVLSLPVNIANIQSDVALLTDNVFKLLIVNPLEISIIEFRVDK